MVALFLFSAALSVGRCPSPGSVRIWAFKMGPNFLQDYLDTSQQCTFSSFNTAAQSEMAPVKCFGLDHSIVRPSLA